MSLTKEVVIDQITVLEDGTMQVREVTRIMEDGKELSHSYHRHCVCPTDNVSNQCQKVKDIAKALYTKECKDAYTAAHESA